jgi:hypothetical protein
MERNPEIREYPLEQVMHRHLVLLATFFVHASVRRILNPFRHASCAVAACSPRSLTPPSGVLDGRGRETPRR